jgi:hypothetical protein
LLKEPLPYIGMECQKRGDLLHHNPGHHFRIGEGQHATPPNNSASRSTRATVISSGMRLLLLRELQADFPNGVRSCVQTLLDLSSVPAALQSGDDLRAFFIANTPTPGLLLQWLEARARRNMAESHEAIEEREHYAAVSAHARIGVGRRQNVQANRSEVACFLGEPVQDSRFLPGRSETPVSVHTRH